MACGGFEVIVALETFHSDCMFGFDELDCSDILSMGGRCGMHKGVKVEMGTHPHSMKQVVNIIVALQRMKHKQSTEFGDDELLNIIMENVIEEHHVNFVNAAQSYVKTIYNVQCSVCDAFQKTLVRSGGSPYLMAKTLKGGNDQYKVRFSLSTYMSPTPTKPGSQPVCLGISKSNLYLACTKAEQSKPPTLVLKEINDTLDTIVDGDAKGYDHLLFYRTESGVSNNTFESVKFPGWFISTAFDDDERVEMCQKSTARINNFMLNDKEVIKS